MRRPSVAIVTDEPGWHGARLREAFAALGVDSRYVSLGAARLTLQGAAPACAYQLPGFRRQGPDAVFVRGIPGGSLEQITFRLDVLHALRERGVPVCNEARAIERTVDKAMTTALLWQAGLPTPVTWVCQDEAEARSVVCRELAAHGAVVLKPLFGSQGQGLQRIERPEALPPPAEVAGVYYLQRFVGGGDGDFRDWRVLVIEGRAVAAMCRRSGHWVTNRAQGARCEHWPLDAGLAALAEAATAATGAGYAGVDLLCEAGGRMLVSEVNGIPAWRGLQAVTPIDLSARLAAHLYARLAETPALGRLA